MKRLMVVYGTRPEAIKMAPVIEALGRSPMFRPTVTVTAQHRGLLDQVHALFGIRADHDLDILTHRQSLADITGRILDRLCPLLRHERPDAVLVQGDTTTAFAGALAAFYSHIPVVHLEAGLRTDDRYAPFPEEINRRLTTQLASLHLAPTRHARNNLLRDGVAPSAVVVTGNTVIDALRWAVGRTADHGYGDPALADLDDTTRRVLLVTSHRREAWGSAMESIGGALADLARSEPSVLIVAPLHPNPVIRAAIPPQVAHLENVRLTEPLDYGAFARLMDRAHLILTDSGGIQEEGPGLGKPVLVLRDTTERPEALRAGTSRLVGTDRERIVKEVRRLLHDRSAYAAMARAVNPYGDGRAADRTVRAIGHWMGLCARPSEFAADDDGDGASAPEAAGVEHGLAAQRGPLDAAEGVVVHEQDDDVGVPHGGGDVDEFDRACACQ
ncbi:non-hydrolyzing UDP-N-acetylglucosamine 2-epimerase [Streptomyces sp. KM273126]|uniref:non-hydrolyzing UDP-N-acetylglucosamine 2-epimerase n=1 Tax=Streptomyces sp. KM273126 TaxID=2545247 RepID=UPI00269EC50C|nr:UDP-N-acetylglucosamine 2-epimerase (non-hydrolyzing) [Streptomyces sp. KM273126]